MIMLVIIMIRICKINKIVSRNKFSVNYDSMYEHVCVSAAGHAGGQIARYSCAINLHYLL